MTAGTTERRVGPAVPDTEDNREICFEQGKACVYEPEDEPGIIVTEWPNTRGFLVVTSGVTIRDRLRVLQPNDPDSYYASRELVPSDMLRDLERAKIMGGTEKSPPSPRRTMVRGTV